MVMKNMSMSPLEELPLAIDVSIVIDPISDILSAMVVIILLRWVKFERKKSKKPTKVQLVKAEEDKKEKD
jgi:phosphate/sulfate permease